MKLKQLTNVTIGREMLWFQINAQNAVSQVGQVWNPLSLKVNLIARLSCLHVLQTSNQMRQEDLHLQMSTNWFETASS